MQRWTVYDVFFNSLPPIQRYVYSFHLCRLYGTCKVMSHQWWCHFDRQFHKMLKINHHIPKTWHLFRQTVDVFPIIPCFLKLRWFRVMSFHPAFCHYLFVLLNGFLFFWRQIWFVSQGFSSARYWPLSCHFNGICQENAHISRLVDRSNLMKNALICFDHFEIFIRFSTPLIPSSMLAIWHCCLVISIMWWF